MEWKQNGSSVWLFSAKLISGLWLCEEPVTWPNVPKTNVLYLANKVPVILSVQLVVWVAVCQCVCQRGLARWPLPSGPANQHHAWAEQLQHRKQTTLWSTSLSSLLALSSFSLSLSSSSSFSLSWLLTRSLSTVDSLWLSAQWEKIFHNLHLKTNMTNIYVTESWSTS